MAIALIIKSKDRIKRSAPTFGAGLAVGATAAAIIVNRIYNPKDMIAMQLPDGVYTHMLETGKGVAFRDGKHGWFTLKWHPND